MECQGFVVHLHVLCGLCYVFMCKLLQLRGQR